MPDVRIVKGDQNNTPIIALHVRTLGSKTNAIPVFLVNISGDTYNAGGGSSSGGDGAILDGSNSSIKATVKQYGNANPLTVVLVNVSGDAYGLGGGGAASNVNLNQVGGVATAVNAGTSDNGTQRVVLASDQTVPVSFPGGVASTQSGGWFVGITGDVSTTPKTGQTWPVREQGVTGVQVVGGAVGGSMGVTGDVLLRANPGTVIGQLGGTVGVNIIGGSIGARISASGDLTVREQSVLGVQIVGGSVGSRISASGDLSISPSTTNFNKFPVSGDTRLIDGSDPTIKATVKSYTRSNPQAVVLVNASGDPYSPDSSSSGYSGSYGRKNITTSATLVMPANTARRDIIVQNLENQQVSIGFDANVTMYNAGVFLSPISGNSSGDGGNFYTDYTGAIYAIVASGDADISFMETIH